MPEDHEGEFRLLTTDAGAALLAEAEGMRAFGPAEIARLRRQASTELAAAAVRLTLARRKAAGKFEQAGRMWLEAVAVEQATAEPVARHKAARFAAARAGASESCSAVVDLCCGIGGDAIALAQDGPVLAVDLDAGMTRRARWNAEVHGVGDHVLAVRSEAERMPIPAGSLVHLDPDRRAGAGPGLRPRGGRPTRAIDDYAPGPSFWKALRSQARGGAIKLSPAADFAAAFPIESGCEVELISLRGECKEATAWFGDLAETGCRRRATRLPEGATWSDGDGEDRNDRHDPRPAAVSPLGELLFDPDPSLIRAGLLDSFARAHRLSRVAEGIDYLTGPEAIASPFLATFAVQDVAPLDLKQLRRMIIRHDVGALEIKVRGLAITPESLRTRLKPEGSQPATLLIVGPGRGNGASVHQPALAVLAVRVAHQEHAPAAGRVAR